MKTKIDKTIERIKNDISEISLLNGELLVITVKKRKNKKKGPKNEKLL
jgi:hypothetical protein